MEFVDSATLIKYNANTRGTNTGDCTTRAISLAFNSDYNTIKKLQNESAKLAQRGWAFNNLENCKRVIRSLGGGEMTSVTDKITVEEFVDSHSGTYIIYCGKYENSTRSTHLVCMINDRVYDSWDSRSRLVKGYWEIKNGLKQEDLTDIQPILKQKLITDRDFQYYNNYVNEVFDKIISKNRKIKKLQQECDFGIDMQIEISRIKLKDYTFMLTCDIDVIYGNSSIRLQTYPGKIVVTFKPTMKEDEIDEHFNVTFFNKFYSYLYGIILKIEDTCEGYMFLGSPSSRPKSLHFYSNMEKKSFEALPYWVKALATYFNISVNRYWDDEIREIVLYMVRPSFDNNYNPNRANDEIDFRAYNMEGLRKGLEYYKKTGDYGRALEIAGNY